MNFSLHSRPCLLNSFLTFSALILLFSSSLTQEIVWVIGPVCLILLWVALVEKKFTLTPLAYCIALFMIMLIINILIINPVFHPISFRIIFSLFFAYLVGRSLSLERAIGFYKIIVVIFLILSGWALFQYITGEAYFIQAGVRSNTIFYTPNTFAAALNIVLLPLIVFRLCNVKIRYLDYYIFLLFVALLMTLSRGGWIAFFCGLSFCLIILTWKHSYLDKRAYIFLAKLLILTAVFLPFNDYFNNYSLTKNNYTDPSSEIEKRKVNSSSIQHRLFFYKVAWNEFKQRPLLGHGFFNFHYFLDRDKPEELLVYETPRFVHNDYLQYLLETGLVGFAFLLALISCIYFQGWLVLNRADSNKPLFLAILATMTACFTHAMVDFILFLPFLLFLIGFYLGVFDRACLPWCQKKEITLIGDGKPIKPFALKSLIATALILILMLPIFAHMAVFKARTYKLINHFTTALEHFQLARKLAPYDAGYIHEEANLWFKAVKERQSHEAAEVADKLLLHGIELNPYEQKNLLSRSILHRDYPELLNEPQGLETVLEWQRHVLYWQPHNQVARRQYIISLLKSGEIEAAKLESKKIRRL